ncbi:hypothetical protein V8G54_008181 [Vigna mungo]|uniref:Retrovirus-related Pol polyprotein from transposon TNT 1-94-like beta-barrel domain-containing protein n=1 Tax=Vigna mungo TaxID=3915 RepID=A0AAQ3S659_VIGMU
MKENRVYGLELSYSKQKKYMVGGLIGLCGSNISRIRNESGAMMKIVDSRVSFHVSSHEGFFSSSNYKKGDFGTVKMANHVTSKIVDIRDVIRSTNAVSKLVLKEVTHAPNMHLNLIYVGKLEDVGFVSHFGAEKWKLIEGSMVIVKGSKEGSLYIFSIALSSASAYFHQGFTICCVPCHKKRKEIFLLPTPRQGRSEAALAADVL